MLIPTLRERGSMPGTKGTATILQTALLNERQPKPLKTEITPATTHLGYQHTDVIVSYSVIALK